MRTVWSIPHPSSAFYSINRKGFSIYNDTLFLLVLISSVQRPWSWSKYFVIRILRLSCLTVINIPILKKQNSTPSDKHPGNNYIVQAVSWIMTWILEEFWCTHGTQADHCQHVWGHKVTLVLREWHDSRVMHGDYNSWKNGNACDI